MDEDLDTAVRLQLENIDIEADRPLLISDADEVLVQFLAGLEKFLARNGLWLDLQSFALVGNIKQQGTDKAVSAEAIHNIVARFFEEDTDKLEPVPGAPEALRALSEHLQVVVLTNVPLDQTEVRRDNLAAHGMAYPLVANIGTKGAAVKWLAAKTQAPTFFVDDLPHNIASVARAHAPTRRIHLVSDIRLSPFIADSTDSHLRAQAWEEVRNFIDKDLSDGWADHGV